MLVTILSPSKSTPPPPSSKSVKNLSIAFSGIARGGGGEGGLLKKKIHSLAMAVQKWTISSYFACHHFVSLNITAPPPPPPIKVSKEFIHSFQWHTERGRGGGLLKKKNLFIQWQSRSEQFVVLLITILSPWRPPPPPPRIPGYATDGFQLLSCTHACSHQFYHLLNFIKNLMSWHTIHIYTHKITQTFSVMYGIFNLSKFLSHISWLNFVAAYISGRSIILLAWFHVKGHTQLIH